jgi:hypothetical protein
MALLLLILKKKIIKTITKKKIKIQIKEKIRIKNHVSFLGSNA